MERALGHAHSVDEVVAMQLLTQLVRIFAKVSCTCAALPREATQHDLLHEVWHV